MTSGHQFLTDEKKVFYLSKILRLKTFLESTNINYLYEKSMDSSVIDQPEADSQTDVFEEKEMIAFAPTAHPKNGTPKISIRGNADVQT